MLAAQDRHESGALDVIQLLLFIAHAPTLPQSVS
jgi:hypothetical protein